VRASAQVTQRCRCLIETSSYNEIDSPPQDKFHVSSTRQGGVIVWGLKAFGPLIERGENNNDNEEFDHYTKLLLLESGVDLHTRQVSLGSVRRGSHDTKSLFTGDLSGAQGYLLRGQSR
jgi:hypothetical protein